MKIFRHNQLHTMHFGRHINFIFCKLNSLIFSFRLACEGGPVHKHWWSSSKEGSCTTLVYKMFMNKAINISSYVPAIDITRVANLRCVVPLSLLQCCVVLLLLSANKSGTGGRRCSTRHRYLSCWIVQPKMRSTASLTPAYDLSSLLPRSSAGRQGFTMQLWLF